MGELEDKLREIKVKCYDGPFYLNDSTLSDENIAQIKQAFQEAGWIAPTDSKYPTLKALIEAAGLE